MAIARDANNGSLLSISCDGSQHTWTHTPIGTPTVVIVMGYVSGGTVAASISSITYGGQTMTLGVKFDNGASASPVVWYLANPPSGAQTVAANTINTSQFLHVTSETYTGTLSTASVAGNTATKDTSIAGTSFTQTIIIGGTSGSWVVGSNIGNSANPSSITYGAQTGSLLQGSEGDSNGSVATGSQTITVNYSSSQSTFTGTWMEIKVAGAASSNVPQLQSMGIGST